MLVEIISIKKLTKIAFLDTYGVSLSQYGPQVVKTIDDSVLSVDTS